MSSAFMIFDSSRAREVTHLPDLAQVDGRRGLRHHDEPTGRQVQQGVKSTGRDGRFCKRRKRNDEACAEAAQKVGLTIQDQRAV
jgi:hypothetical protein